MGKGAGGCANIFKIFLQEQERIVVRELSYRVIWGRCEKHWKAIKESISC